MAGFWRRIGNALGFGRGGGRGGGVRPPWEPAPEPPPIEDNGLPTGWHFVGLVDDNGKIDYVDDSVTDRQIRDADRVFIAKTWPDGHTSYRQFSAARNKDAIGDMLIRESGEGSPV